ncbi:MAG: helix-turn-helix domain-containing protein [bacterium]|nr:helix-turn-helix domain-containing protein [bacterium]
MAAIKNPVKIEIGQRFRRFRQAIHKTQTQLAKELNIYQSTITNIEVGKTFPNIKYLLYFHRTYHLNTNWLFTGAGEIFIVTEEPPPTAASLLDFHLQRANGTYDKYTELMELMQIPLIEQLMLAKLLEIKVLARDEIKEFREKEKKEKKA